MKNIIFISIITALLTSACSKDETVLQDGNKIIFIEDFNNAQDNTSLDLVGWKNYLKTGRNDFKEQIFSGNGYAEFTTFRSTGSEVDDVNVAWLISPAIINENNNKLILHFQTAQSFLTSRDNSLEVFASSNFDGTNIEDADWIKLPAKICAPETKTFAFVSSGEIDMSNFSNKFHFAFKAKGSETNKNLDATYQIDNTMIYYKIKQ